MKNIFNPITRLFKLDYKTRLEVSLKDQLYDAKLSYIKNAQHKQYVDAMVVYQANRVLMLTEMVNKLKGPEDENTSSITSATICAPDNLSNGQGVRLSSP
jgi:hypothetical protein